MSNHSQSSSPRSNNKQRHGRGPITLDSFGRPVLAANGSVDIDNVKSSEAMRRRITQDLPRINRFFDPNRIVLEMPPGFQSPQSLPEKGKGPEVGQHDMHVATISSSHLLARDLSHASSPTNERARTISARIEASSYSLASGLASSSPITVQGGGRIDPFANYPIEMNEGELWLIDQVNTSQDPTLRALRERWLPVVVKDAASFHQFLANAALNVSRVHGEEIDNALIVAHYSLAIRSVNQKLSDAVARIGDDVVVSILLFICYNTNIEDFESVAIHLRGLKDVIRLRGGFGTIDNDPVLSSLVFGVDMTRSLAQDNRPEFPLPIQLLQHIQSNNSTEDINQAPHWKPWKQIFPSNHILTTLFDDLHNSIKIINQNSASNQQWNTTTFLARQIYPILHHLFLARTEIDPNDKLSIIQEASRLGIVLFLGEVRRQCGAVCTSTKLYVRKLKLLLEGVGRGIEWGGEDLVLLLWTVFLGVLESWGMEEGQWFLGCLREVMGKMELRSWEEVVESVKGVLWVDELFDVKVELVRGIFHG